MDDRLPTCPEHVWALANAAGSDVAVAAARHTLGTAAAAIDLAGRALLPPPRHRRRSARLEERLFGAARRERWAREALARSVPCAVCRRLSVAEERTSALLFVLAEHQRYRRAVEAGYGLCLRHLVRALGLDPPAAVRRTLVEIETARLARLEWELDEALRKSSWDCRPEAWGAEAGAWRRAMAKFSGSLAERD